MMAGIKVVTMPTAACAPLAQAHTDKDHEAHQSASKKAVIAADRTAP
jgi:hypothetical protein